MYPTPLNLHVKPRYRAYNKEKSYAQKCPNSQKRRESSAQIYPVGKKECARSAQISPGILAKKMGQPRTNCNKRFFLRISHPQGNLNII